MAALSTRECSGLYASSSFRVIKLFPLEIKVVVRFCIEELSEETYYKEGGQKKTYMSLVSEHLLSAELSFYLHYQSFFWGLT